MVLFILITMMVLAVQFTLMAAQKLGMAKAVVAGMMDKAILALGMQMAAVVLLALMVAQVHGVQMGQVHILKQMVLLGYITQMVRAV
jgi:hypothetical protein